MARLNARRRMEARLKVARIVYAKDRNPSIITSEGAMRSSHKTDLLATQRFHAPKPVNFDKPGVKGRIVKGQLKPLPGRKLWSK